MHGMEQLARMITAVADIGDGTMLRQKRDHNTVLFLRISLLIVVTGSLLLTPARADQGKGTPEQSSRNDQAASTAQVTRRPVTQSARDEIDAIVRLLGSEEVTIRRKAALRFVTRVKVACRTGDMGWLQVAADASCAQLVAIAEDDKEKKDIRLCAVRALGLFVPVNDSVTRILDIALVRLQKIALFEPTGAITPHFSATLYMLELGPAVVPMLIEGVKNANWRIRHNAVRLLGRMGKRAQSAKAVLREALVKDESVDVREAAARAIGRIAIHALVPELTAVLSDSALPIRRACAFALGDIGAPHATPASAALRKALQRKSNPEWLLRTPIGYALARVNPKSDEGVLILIGVLGEGSDSVGKYNTCPFLGKLGADARKAIPALAELAKRYKGDVGKAAKRVLKMIRDDCKKKGIALTEEEKGKKGRCASNWQRVDERAIR